MDDDAYVFIMPIGIPASGKTKIRKDYLKRQPHLKVISPDDIRARLFNAGVTSIYHDPEQEDTVWGLAFIELYRALNSGDPVYFDATNLHASYRDQLIEKARQADYYIIACYFKIPLWLALLRNKNREVVVPDDVIKRMYKSLEEPTPDEYDYLIVYKQKPTLKERFKRVFS